MTGQDRSIAIVGIGLRFPDAADLAQWRANLWAGRDSVAPMPAARAAATGIDPRSAAVPAGYLEDVATFDYAFFGLSKREAALIDPQQRLALVLALRAVEDAGYATSALRAVDTAVIFGATPAPLYGALSGANALGALGSAGFGAAARVAHALGLTGPCYAIDSGCNASLLAVHQACRELRDGTAEYALAGGVSVRAFGVGADEAAGFGELVSPSGRCRAFDAQADGTAIGEGGAALLLTTVERAEADRAPIHAVIRGSATLHNGRSAATISTPSARAQTRVIEAAWRAAGLPVESAGYLEAHGSGTRLGDAVELEAITALGRDQSLAPLAIGSVKTNIGHLDHAAGIAGVVKAVLSVEHGELYPSLHFETPTGGVDLAAAGIEVVPGPVRWPDRDPVRRAGVSSFSLGGMNAHCVIEQPPHHDSPDAATPSLHDPSAAQLTNERHDASGAAARLIAVSARTGAALRQLCGDLAEALRGRDFPIDDIARTLNQGRDHHAHRIALRAKDIDDLVASLDAHARESAEAQAASGPPAVVLLFSPDAHSVHESAFQLPPELPATGATARLLGAQLAFHDELRRCGVNVKAVLGSGVSRYSARYLAGAGEPVSAAELAAAALDHHIDVDRLTGAVRHLCAEGPVLFVEPAAGSLGPLVAQALSENGELLSPANDPMSVIGRLYELGFDPDWDAIGPSHARRLRMPGHPLAGSHCWVDISWQPPPATPDPTPPVPQDAGDPLEWLCRTVRTLLDVEREVTPEDDYFDLGGNSILALQLLDRITETYGVRPQLVDIYEHSTVAEFAGIIASGSAPAAGLPPVEPQDEHLMSFGQVRMWFHHQLDPDTTLYNLPMVIRLDGPIEADAIRGTFVDLAARHEGIRSNFVAIDGHPQLRIRPELGDFFGFTDVSGAPDPTAAARELVATAARVRFDLADDPLMRVLLIRLAPDAHVLQVTMHHAVNDGGSPQIVRRELPELYRARLAGRPAELPPLPVQYRDYARWQRDLVAGNALDAELSYWIETLTGAPLLNLPLDHPRPPRKSFAGEMHIFVIPEADITALRALAARESVSLFVVLLAAFHLVLARYSGQSDIVIGTPTTGRNRPELSGLIGYFNSTVALRADLSGVRGVGDWLRAVRGVVLSALDHQEIPFDHVVQALGGERDPGRTPIFDAFHVHQELPLGESGGEAVTDFFDQHRTVENLFPGMPVGTAKFDLTLLTMDHGARAGMDACFEYSTDLFVDSTVADMTQAYLEILRALAGSPTERPIGEIVTPATSRPQYSAVRIPADRPRPERARYTTDRIHRRTTPELLHRDSGELNPILLSAWAVLLSWYSGADTIDLDTATAGTYRPLRITLADDPSLSDLLERMPLPDTTAEIASLPVRYVGPDTSAPTGDAAELTLSVTRTGEVVLLLDYATELFDEPTADLLLTDLHRILAGLLREPDRPCQDVALDAVDDDLADA